MDPFINIDVDAIEARQLDSNCTLRRDAHRAAYGASDDVLHKAVAGILGTEYDPRAKTWPTKVYVPAPAK